jgi:hypothetical protein
VNELGQIHSLARRACIRCPLCQSGAVKLKNDETDPTFPTSESIIIELDPTNPWLQIAPGPPDRYRYNIFDFKKGFVETEE